MRTEKIEHWVGYQACKCQIIIWTEVLNDADSHIAAQNCRNPSQHNENNGNVPDLGTTVGRHNAVYLVEITQVLKSTAVYKSPSMEKKSWYTQRDPTARYMSHLFDVTLIGSTEIRDQVQGTKRNFPAPPLKRKKRFESRKLTSQYLHQVLSPAYKNRARRWVELTNPKKGTRRPSNESKTSGVVELLPCASR